MAEPAASYPNHPLLYATHQQPNSSGNVSAMLHQIGRVKSMARPRTMNSIQKILRSIRKNLTTDKHPFRNHRERRHRA